VARSVSGFRKPRVSDTERGDTDVLGRGGAPPLAAYRVIWVNLLKSGAACEPTHTQRPRATWLRAHVSSAANRRT